jgi:hypothetical protein
MYNHSGGIMIIGLLIYTGFLTLVIVAGIHNYEAKIKSYKEAIGDYKRALNLAKHHSNAEHYTHLQLENKRMVEVDRDNHLLQQRVKVLQEELTFYKNGGGNQGIQYESSVYKTSQWESNSNLEYKDTERIIEI